MRHVNSIIALYGHNYSSVIEYYAIMVPSDIINWEIKCVGIHIAIFHYIF